MDKSIAFSLLAETRTQDSIGQFVTTDTPRQVFGQITSVSADEFFEGGRNGFKPEYRITMFAYDYQDERRCLIGGTEYSVYRVYRGRTDKIELYLEKRAGNNPAPEEEAGNNPAPEEEADGES